jgi:hypothetical protein
MLLSFDIAQERYFCIKSSFICISTFSFDKIKQQKVIFSIQSYMTKEISRWLLNEVHIFNSCTNWKDINFFNETLKDCFYL